MRVVQLTDLHLTDNQNQKLLETDTYHNFSYVLKEINRMKNKKHIDLIIISGDITHDCKVSVYDYFLEKIESLNIPYIIIPGNHDIKQHLDQAISERLPGFLINEQEYRYKEWYITSVDTVVEGEDYGFITAENMEKLNQKLTANSGSNIALFMHHHPTPVGTPIVDECKLLNSDNLLKLCVKHKVKLTGCGHAHTHHIP